jgi:hypothetical protein
MNEGQLIAATREAVANGLVSPDVWTVLNQDFEIPVGDHRVCVEELTRTYRRRHRKYSEHNGEDSEISRLLDALARVRGDVVELIPISVGGLTRTLFLVDPLAERVLHWSPMWDY